MSQAVRVPGFSLILIAIAAKAHLKAGHVAQAMDLLAQAVELADRTDVALHRAEIERLQAMTMLGSGRISRTEAILRLQAAAALAQRQGAATQIWRTLIDLAEQLSANGEIAQARDILRDAMESAPAGCDVVELTAARSALARLH